MTAAEVPAGQLSDGGAESTVAPLGRREVVEGRVLVGPVAIDLGTAALTTEQGWLGGAPSPTLVVVDAADPTAIGSEAVRAASGHGVAVRLSLAATPDPAAAVAQVETAALGQGVDGFDLLVIDGADPFRHPAAAADLALSAMIHGGVPALGVTGHTVAQARALAAHLPPEIRVAVLGVDLAELSWAALTDGALDLALEWGAVPLVPLHAGLVGPSASRVEARTLAALLHHPARPLLLVDHDDVAGRLLAAEACATPLTLQEIRRLLG